MTSKEMRKATCPLGYWFENVAPLGKAPDWQIRVMPLRDDTRLFGYDQDAFLAKQYRKTA